MALDLQLLCKAQSACIILLLWYMFVFCLVGVSFNQSTYTVNESSQQVQPVLVLSKPSSVNITIQVTDTASTATSK